MSGVKPDLQKQITEKLIRTHTLPLDTPPCVGRRIRSTSGAMRVVIVEDHLMFREILRKVCARDLHHEVVGEAADGPAAIEVITRTLPDLVLLDLHLPDRDGFSVVEAVQQAAPNVRILVLSSHCDEYTVFRVEEAKVQGFVDKNTNTFAILKAAIAAVGAGQRYYSEAFLRIRAARHRNPQAFDKLLTDRERAVLELIGEPLSDREISGRLGISAETVAKHRFNLLGKLGLRNTSELARYARENGFTRIVPRSGSGALLP
jgi:DNA-binding NarL/FixJ family response regulator